MQPLIAIPAYHLAAGRVKRWPAGGFGIPSPYVEAVRRAGGRPVILAGGDDADPEDILEPFDGLLLVGGGDVAPERYVAAAGVLYGLEPDRDGLEIGLLRGADRMRVPTLAICRGIQVMNVAFGGTLHQNLPDVPGLLDHGTPIERSVTRHDIRVDPDSRLLAATKSSVVTGSSHHHQGLDRLGEGLVVTGRSEDGLAEAIERQEGWMLGVQWHPEDTAASDESNQALFDGLVLLARVGAMSRPRREPRTTMAPAPTEEDA